MAKAGIRIPVDLRIETQDTFERLKSNQYLIYNQVAKSGKILYENQTPSPYRPVALGGLWKDESIDENNINSIRKEMWKDLGW